MEALVGRTRHRECPWSRRWPFWRGARAHARRSRGRANAEHEAPPRPLRDHRRRALRRHPRLPRETIDRRLLTDIRRLVRRYKIFVTDGYSLSDVHAANGEHPLGLALDIVPDKERGGTWNRIDRLAAWAEPEQGEPRAPFRWVGYDGDANHGRGHHLHLSWSHSVSGPGRPARTVYTMRCPSPPPRHLRLRRRSRRRSPAGRRSARR